jgi:phenylalanyl-tRNA synthetase beta chain
MKFSEKWLRTLVNPPISTNLLCEQLTNAGLEVESLTSKHGKFQGVVIGEVISIEKHPAADRLHVCKVNIGNLEPLVIVCGASNVRPGLKAPVALLNATLADGTKIKKAKLRGVESTGMLCSEKELGLAEESAGLMELPNDAPIGKGFHEYLSLDDNIIELNITPNRGDSLSVLGIAREVAALNNCIIDMPKILEPRVTSNKAIEIKIIAKEAAAHYVGVVLSGINNLTKIPFWLKERIENSGIRSINPVVDVLNYVMLELGQPMHAFDLSKIEGEISVRFAAKNEEIHLLNGTTINVMPEDLVIADQKKLLALAGIMGSKIAEVSLDTKDVFLESAFFAPDFIFESVKRYGLSSEAAHRFERYVDYNLQYKALARAIELLTDIVGGSLGPIKEITYADYLPKINPIPLRRLRSKHILGIDLSDDVIATILKNLNFEVKTTELGWEVIPPSYRSDLNTETDLLEEIARIYGYDKIPRKEMVLPLINPGKEIRELAIKNCRRLKTFMMDQGYHEVINYSFIDVKMQTLFEPDTKPVELLNPISSDLSVLRTSLWPGLVSSLIYNKNRQQERLRFYEVGLKFLPAAKGILREQNTLAGIIMGNIYPISWNSPKRDSDFFDLKHDVEKIVALFSDNGKKSLQFKAELHPSLHPSISAGIYLGEEPIGFLGSLHPRICEHLSINCSIFLFELDLSFLGVDVDLKFKEISKFPFVERDLAILIDEKKSWDRIKKIVENTAGNLLRDIRAFDVYRGKGIPPEYKSIALRLTFQHMNRTLTEEEVEILMQNVIAALTKELGVKIRG